MTAGRRHLEATSGARPQRPASGSAPSRQLWAAAAAVAPTSPKPAARIQPSSRRLEVANKTIAEMLKA